MLWADGEQRPEEQLFEAAAEAQKRHGGMAGAKHLFSLDGLDPRMWSVSRAQLLEFRAEVRQSLKEGKITNYTNPGQADYDEETFNDPERGPNMYQASARTRVHTART